MQRIVTITLNPTVDVSIEVDTLIGGPKLRSPYAHYDPGGGGINVARGIRRFDGEVEAVYTAGGAVGELLRQLVEQEGVAQRVVPIAQTTRESFNVLETRSGQLYRFVLPGPALTAAEADRCLQAVAQTEPPAHYWVASGSLPPGVADDFYVELAQLAQRHKARLILDTSGPALRTAAQAGVYLIKPNQKELGELIGRESSSEADWRSDCRQLVDSGSAEIVVLSLGADGALLTSRNEQLRVAAPKVRVQSPVGAGDSFVALLTLQLARGEALATALDYAVAAGAAAAMTPATELFRRQDVERLYAQMSGPERARD